MLQRNEKIKCPARKAGNIRIIKEAGFPCIHIHQEIGLFVSRFNPELPVRHLPESGIRIRILYVFQTLLLLHPEGCDLQTDRLQSLRSPYPHGLLLCVQSRCSHRKHSASCVPGIRSAMLPHGSVPLVSASLHHLHR